MNARESFKLHEFDLETCDVDEVRSVLLKTGAVRFPGFVGPDRVAELQQAWQDLSDRFVREDRAKVHGIPIKYGQRADGTRYVQRFAFASLFDTRFHHFLHDGRFEKVRRICGEHMRIGDRERDGLVINCYRNEPGSRYKQLGWHTDGLRSLFYGKLPGPMWNVGFYLDDSPIAKGALRILPESHTQGFWDMLTRKLYFVDTRPDPQEVVVEAQAGDLTIHDGRLWHRVGQSSLEGIASQRRTMYIPMVTGPYQPKDERSPTPLYHHLQRVTG